MKKLIIGGWIRGNSVLRFLDRYFLIPVLFTLGLFRCKKQKPKKMERIGVLVLNAIGDSIITMAPIMDMAMENPSAKIILFVTSENASVFNLFPHKFTIEIINLCKIFGAVSRIVQYQLDILIDCSQWVRISGILSFFSRAHFIIGFKTAQQFRHYVYDAYVSHSSTVHEIDNYRNLVKILGVISTSLPRIVVPNAEKQKIIAQRLGNYVLFHPWPSGYKSELRCWPEENWVGLARYILALGYTLIITGGRNDYTVTQRLLVKINHNRAISFIGHSLVEVSALLALTNLLVTVNTGIMHLAAAIDVPMIVLNGPTSRYRWGPLSSKAVVMLPKCALHGYLYLGFEYPRKIVCNCMQYIFIGDVIQQLPKVLQSA